MYAGLLPIGSVVKVAGIDNNMMIIGYFQVADNEPDIVRDYAGVVYPGGIGNTDEVFQFDREAIEGIPFIGYEDEEQHDFIMQLNMAEQDIKNQFKQEN